MSKLICTLLTKHSFVGLCSKEAHPTASDKHRQIEDFKESESNMPSDLISFYSDAAKLRVMCNLNLLIVNLIHCWQSALDVYLC